MLWIWHWMTEKSCSQIELVFLRVRYLSGMGLCGRIRSLLTVGLILAFPPAYGICVVSPLGEGKIGGFANHRLILLQMVH